MDIDHNTWNISKLDSILSRVFKEEGVQIPGVNTPYLYYGMWRSTFPWHVEDVDLYSINYLHYGLPKCWYVIPPAYARKFEAFVSEYFRSEFLKCHCFLRHKCVLISPTVLSQAGIPTRRILQYEGEFMITFPYAYHSGFNMGLNIAESTNFALDRWIEYGKHAKICTCWDDTVKICMDPFVRRFQPELFDDWKIGKNPQPHPLDEYLLREMGCHAENTSIYPNSSKVLLGVQRLAVTSVNYIPTEPLPFKQSPPKLGDLNYIDMRYSLKQFKKAKLPYHISKNASLCALWCGNSFNEETERNFNIFIGSNKPYCAVCSFLWTPQHISKLLSSGHEDEELPAYSEPHIPEVAYHSFYDSPLNVPPDVKSRIMRCCRCCLTVHSRCYGVSDEVFSGQPSKSQTADTTLRTSWLCDACTASAKPTCVFCYMRGGAMKALANDVPKRLAFISEDCVQSAVTSAELCSKEKDHYTLNQTLNTTSENKLPPDPCLSSSFYVPVSNYLTKNMKLIRKRSLDSSCNNSGVWECRRSSQEDRVCMLKTIKGLKLLNWNNISDDHYLKKNMAVKSIENNASPIRSKCVVCRLPGRGFLPLAPCWYDGCSARFHVTCAQMAGVVIGTDVYPRLFYLACSKHPTNYDHPNFHDQGSVSPGDEVMVQEINDLKFTSAIAIRRVTPLYCRISFPDGTFSSDTPPEYLTVQLESGDTRILNREQFYVQPKKKCTKSARSLGSVDEYSCSLSGVSDDDLLPPSNS
ncbi:unnamed protein product [Heterobilharzia americana]|nr:unnamed protein product [Heterobilharzia americana]